MLTVADTMTSDTRLTSVFFAVYQHIVFLSILIPEDTGLLLSGSNCDSWEQSEVEW